jgi:hypothetical protein
LAVSSVLCMVEGGILPVLLHGPGGRRRNRAWVG